MSEPRRTPGENRGEPDQLEGHLTQKHTVETPENVAFGYTLAGIGNRFLAAALDSALLAVLLILLVAVTLAALQSTGDLDSASEALSWAGGVVLAVSALLNFIVIWGYYIFFETVWNGQTPGKRRLQIRVVDQNGAPAGMGAIIIRNLVRIVDFLPSFYGLGILVMFVSRRAQRLGDLAAGTLVIKEGSVIELSSLTGGRETDEKSDVPSALISHLHRLSADDMDLILAALDRYEQRTLSPFALQRLARSIAVKLGVDSPVDAEAFLRQVSRGQRGSML